MLLHLVENSLIDNEELKIKSIIDDMNLIKVQALLTLQAHLDLSEISQVQIGYLVKQTLKRIGCHLFVRR